MNRSFRCGLTYQLRQMPLARLVDWLRKHPVDPRRDLEAEDSICFRERRITEKDCRAIIMVVFHCFHLCALRSTVLLELLELSHVKRVSVVVGVAWAADRLAGR